MKRFSIRTISLILCLAMVAGYIVLPDVPAAKAEAEVITTLGPNLIANGTFGSQKTVTTYPQMAMPEGWTIGGIREADVEYLQVTNEFAYDGQYAMKLVDTLDSKAVSGYQNVTAITPADAGKSVTASFYGKGSGTVTLSIEYYNSDTTFATSGANKTLITSTTKKITVTDVWTKYELTKTIPDGTEAIRYKVTTNNANVAELFFDSVELCVGDNGSNLLVNSSFETLPDAEPTTQGGGAADTTGWTGVTGIWSIGPEDGNESNYVLKVDDTSTSVGKSVSYAVDVEAGATYTFKMDYKGTYSAVSPNVVLRKDSANSADNDLYKQYGLVSETWTTHEATVTIPAGSTKLYVVLASSSVAVGTAMFDNISLQKVTTTTGGNEGGNQGGNEGGTTVPAGNLIANGTFEANGAANLEGWTGLLKNQFWSVVADPDKAENFILKLVDEATNAGSYITYKVPTEPGTYTLKLDYKTANNPQILVRADSTSGDNLLKINLPATDGRWKTYEGTFQVPATASSVCVMLNSATAAVNSGYFDNISLEKTTQSGGGESGGETGDDTIKPGEEIVIPEYNLLPNPFFELTLRSYCTPLTADTAPSGWTMETVGTDVQAFKTNVREPFKGNWSVQIVDNSTKGYFKLSTKVENIQPGVEYRYIFARTGSGMLTMYVRYYDANDQLVGEFSNGQYGNEKWRESGRMALAPAEASYAIISLESLENKKCDMYLDAVRFYSESDPNKTNLLPNWTFEEYPESLEDVFVSARNEGTTLGWKFSTSGGNATLVKTETELDKAAAGNYMVLLEDTSDASGVTMYYELDVVPGKTYAFSVLFRGEYTAGNPGLRIVFYQDEECKIYAPPRGSKNYTAVTGGCGTDYWSRVSGSEAAPDNAVKMRVYVASAGASMGYVYVGNCTLIEGIDIRFKNLDMEDTDQNGAMLNWESYENAAIAPSSKAVFAGKLSMQVKDNSQAEQQGVISRLTDLGGYKHAGLITTDMTNFLSARVKDSKGVKGQLTLIYYDHGLEEISRHSVLTDGSGKWQFMRLNPKMPANAAYAKILLSVGENASATGTLYLDDLTFMSEYANLIEEPYDWQILEDEGNRVYFTDEELEKIKEFSKDYTVNAFGISGAKAYNDLIKNADSYIAATHYTTGWDPSPDNDRVTTYTVNLIHIQDVSCDPVLLNAYGGRNWPYLEGISTGIYTRMSTVAFAYALTGDVKYANRAIGWAMDLCQWEYWSDTQYCWGMGWNGTLDNQRLMRATALVYDMCYDRLTQEQRDIIVQNIIQKGMIPMSFDLDDPGISFHNKYMARCVGIIVSGAAIINEENKAEVGKYMDKAYAYCQDFIDERYTTDNNEGYSYTKMSTDDMLDAMACARRVTGRDGLLKHPFFSEVLIDWVCDFLSPTKNEFPVFSDSYASGFFKPTMLILNRELGSGKAGYFLQQVGMDKDPFNSLIYGAYEPVITQPTENDYVVFAERVGYGGMRTGWEDGELMFYIIGNNSNTGHNNYDQLSFQITTDGLWPAADPGYSNLQKGFDEQEGHNAIIVDGIGQSVKGTATLKNVVDGQLYGQLSGSAPETYTERDKNGVSNGVPLLTQWDRHAIMINHADRPYYIVIDEIASDVERTFDFNLNTIGWEEITVDGKPLGDEIIKGNKVAIYGNNGYIFTEFVSKNKLNIEAKMYEDGGPVLQADNGLQKSQQFMTIMSKGYGFKIDNYYSFVQLVNTPELVKYKTSSPNAEVTKSVNASGTPAFFFRGASVGDWIEMPFTAPETGNFELILKIPKSYNYGIYKIYIDGELMTTYDGYDLRVYAYNLSLGKHDIEAGEHTLKLELVGSNPMTVDNLISVSSITFGTERSMPENPIYTQEVYDNDKVLGAKIFHTEHNYDVVLHNRTTGKITAGGVTTNGEQAVIIGQMEDGYMEGFTMVAGTSLVFNGKTLAKASSAATVSADFRGKAQYFVSTEKKQTISFYAPYEILGASVDGKEVDCKVSGNVASLSVPAGVHTVKLKVTEAVEYLWGDETGSGKVLYNENGEMTYKYWNGEDGTEYLFEDGLVKINAYFDAKTKVLVREELLEDGSLKTTTHNIAGNVASIVIEHTNGNVTTIKYNADGSVSTAITDKRGDYLEMTMEYKDGSKTVAQYLDDKTITTKYDTNGKVQNVTTMHNDGRREEATYDETGRLLSVITRLKGGSREETIYNADGTVVTSIYTANKLSSKKTVNADGTAVLEEYLEDGSVRVTKYDADGNVTEVTIDGKPVEEEKEENNLWIILVIGAAALIAVAVLVIVLVKIKKRNTANTENTANEA